ncbi:MAG TPA: hypothetical protein VH143_35825 [Kofleriaceae bacterium]|jgi:hypothetical protein|nr:hypothetical protein [Kofleriaceae bacterium]
MLARCLVVAGLVAAKPAFADAPVDSYRLEVAGADAAVVGALALGHNSDAVIELSIATYALAGPIIHAVHGRYGTAAGSLFMRAALPLLGGVLGYALTAGTTSNGGGEPALEGGAGGAIVGVVAGAVAASAIDIGVFAKGDGGLPRLAPAITPTAHDGMTFGVAGRF